MTHSLGGQISRYYTDDPGNEGRGAGIYRKINGKYLFVQRRAGSAITEPRPVGRPPKQQTAELPGQMRVTEYMGAQQ